MVNVQYVPNLALSSCLPPCAPLEKPVHAVLVYSHTLCCSSCQLRLMLVQSISGCLSHRRKMKIQTDQSNTSYVYQNVVEYSEIDWSLCFFVFFLQSDKQPESTVVLTYVLPVVPKLLYQRFRQIVCICVHLTAQIVLLTSPPRQLALALVPIYLSSIQGEVFKLSKLL